MDIKNALKYPKELDSLKNKYQVSYRKEVKKASAEIKELIDDEVKKRSLKEQHHRKFEFANF